MGSGGIDAFSAPVVETIAAPAYGVPAAYAPMTYTSAPLAAYSAAPMTYSQTFAAAPMTYPSPMPVTYSTPTSMSYAGLTQPAYTTTTAATTTGAVAPASVPAAPKKVTKKT